MTANSIHACQPGCAVSTPDNSQLQQENTKQKQFLRMQSITDGDACSSKRRSFPHLTKGVFFLKTFLFEYLKKSNASAPQKFLKCPLPPKDLEFREEISICSMDYACGDSLLGGRHQSPTLGYAWISTPSHANSWRLLKIPKISEFLGR